MLHRKTGGFIVKGKPSGVKDVMSLYVDSQGNMSWTPIGYESHIFDTREEAKKASEKASGLRGVYEMAIVECDEDGVEL